jgi:hypothetical protein
MNFGNDAPGPGVLTFRAVMLSLILLELNVEVIIHRVNELPTFHAGFFRGLFTGKHWASSLRR